MYCFSQSRCAEKLSKEDGLEIIEKTSKDEVEGLRKYFEINKMNENNETIEEIV